MNQLLRALLGTVVIAAFASSAYGQPAWALPAKTPETPVACSGCPNTPAGAMTVGYKAPIISFTGRFLDSVNVRDYQATFRTGRAWSVTVNETTKRIYFRIGSSVFAYSLDTFFQRLEANEPLMYSTSFPVNPPNGRQDGTEVFLKWDEYFYPEYNGSGWKTIKIDRQEFIESFDVDNEGYVYIPAEQLGWGIVKDSGAKSGGLMANQFQRFLQSGDPAPYRMVALKASGNRMIAIVSGPTNESDVWDVSNRKSPSKIGDRPEAVRSWAKTTNGDIAAMVDWGSKMRIMTGDQLASNGVPLFQGDNYLRVATDGTNFYALKLTAQGGRLAVIVPSGSGYVEQNAYALDPTFQITLDTKLNYGAGYIFLAGADTAYGWDARLYKVSNLVPTLVPILAHPTGTSYFKTYYAQGSGGYVAPGGPYINMMDGTVVKHTNGKTYLIICVKGLGDVYELKGSDSITVSPAEHAGAPNAFIDPPANNAKIFYGDSVRFSSSSQGTVAAVNWDFGNPQAGSLNNKLAVPLLTPVTYQYSHLNKSQLGTKVVTATATNSGEVKGTTTLTLEAPTARFSARSSTGDFKFLFTVPNASSPATIIPGDLFVDSSDGYVEGHYVQWTKDGQVTKAAPNQPLPVGDCGGHNLKFETFYGPYDTAYTTIGAPSANFVVDLGGTSTVTYAVRPVAAAVHLTSSAGSTLNFSSVSRSSLAGTFESKWELLNGAGAVVGASGPTPTTLAAVPTFAVPKSTIAGTTNWRVRLTLKALTPATGACAGLDTSVALSNPLNGPNPKIVQTGSCDNGGSCSFSVQSLTGIDPDSDGWTGYTWTITRSTGAAADSSDFQLSSGNLSSKSFSPRFLKVGTYNIGLSVSNAITSGSATPAIVTISTAPALCSQLTNDSWQVTYQCPNGSTCSVNDTIELRAVSSLYSGYEPNCTSHTFAWRIGGVSVGSSNCTPPGCALPPALSTTFTGATAISVEISNGSASRTYTGNIGATVQPPPQQPPPQQPPPQQPPPSTGCAQMNANSWTLTYNGSSSNCTPGGANCTAGESVTYRADASIYSNYDPSCSPGGHTFTWTFPGGGGGNTNPATTTFNGAGQASVRIQNSYGGFYTYYINVSGGGTVTPPPTTPPTTPPPAGGGNCGTARPGVELWIDYTNASQTCGPLGNRCNAGEPVNFSVRDYAPYTLGCANHTFEWDFGDGSAKVNGGKDMSHTYATAGDYPLKVKVNNTFTTIEIPLTVGVGAIAATPDVKADLSASEVAGETLAYKFVARFSPSDLVKEWYWNFGDGSPERKGRGTPSNPLAEFYQYAQPGTYTVTLRMIDTFGRELPPYRETLGSALSAPLTPNRRRAAQH